MGQYITERQKETLECYIQNDYNATKTAEEMDLHPSTVRQHIDSLKQKIKEVQELERRNELIE